MTSSAARSRRGGTFVYGALPWRRHCLRTASRFCGAGCGYGHVSG